MPATSAARGGRSRPPRKPVSVRLTDAGVDAVQAIADRYQCDQSEAIRRMLKVGYKNMPATWREDGF